MVTISKEISDGATALAVNRIHELLASRGVSSTPVTSEIKDNIAIGINDDEEDTYDLEDETAFFDTLDEGTEEEVEEVMSSQSHKKMTSTPKGYKRGNVLFPEQFRRFNQKQEEYKSAGEKAVNKAGMHTSFINPEMQQKAASTRNKNYDDFVFGSGSYEIFGKSKKCTEVAFNLNFTNSDADNLEDNMERLSDAITFEVVKNFPKIHNIAVSNNYLIVNDTCFIPNIVNNGAKFPLDSLSYIQNGCIAPFINWRKLFKHSRNTCVSLSIDSTEFYITYVGDSLDLGRKIGVSTAFKVLDNLNSFYLEGEEVTREKLESPDSAGIKKKLATKKRNFKIMDGYKLDICKGTQGLQDFTFNNLKEYATNRGNKGFIRYAFGTVARFGFAAIGGVLNAGTHLVRGVLRGGKELVKNAITPVEDDDIYS